MVISGTAFPLAMATTKNQGRNRRNEKVLCSVCGGGVGREETRWGDRGTLYEDKPLCEACWEEDEACATVYYGDDETPNIIGEARNDTDGEFTLVWHSLDSWRGSYAVSSPHYALLNEAELLAWHESQTMLKSFDEAVRGLLRKHGIGYARVFSRTSNVFCRELLPLR